MTTRAHDSSKSPGEKLPDALGILVGEDSESDALLIERTIRKAGYQVNMRCVATAEGMAEALADGDWDIVFVDYVLPIFGERGALTTLRESGEDIPCIVVSDSVGEEAAVGILKAGAGEVG